MGQLTVKLQGYHCRLPHIADEPLVLEWTLIGAELDTNGRRLGELSRRSRRGSVPRFFRLTEGRNGINRTKLGPYEMRTEQGTEILVLGKFGLVLDSR